MTQRNTNHAAEIIYDHITYIVIAFVLPLICKSFTDQLNPEFSLSFQYVPIHWSALDAGVGGNRPPKK